MARERVQVQGLGGAVPGISPTIQRAGQYGIQVQRAGRNKLMDLADALGQVNPILQQYTRVADIEAEQFEEELAGKSPEEVQAMLKQTEGELDKQVRRGGMGWLTSPLNQKRKLKAVGRAASRALMVDITSRLENPLADDPDDGFELARILKDEYISNNPALANSVFAQEGLQEAINPQVQQLVINFERKKTAIAKRESGLAVTSNFFDTIEGLLKTDDYQEGSISSGQYSEALKQIWDDTNAHTPDEQRNIFKATLQQLAKQGMRNEAEELLIYARGNLKFGNASMTEIEENEYEEFIENTAEKAEKDLEREEGEATNNLIAEAYNALVDIKTGKQGEFNGNSYNTVADLERAVNDYDALLETNKSRLRKSFMSDVNNFKKPSDLRKERAFYNLDKDFVAPAFSPEFASKLADDLSNEFTDAATIIEQNPQVYEDGYLDVLDDLRDEADRLSLEYDDVFELQKALRPIARKLISQKKQDIKQSYRDLADSDKKKKDLVTTTVSSAGNEEVIEPSFWQEMVGVDPKLEVMHEIKKVKNLIDVSFNDKASPVESEKAHNLLNDLDLVPLVEVASRRKKIVKEPKDYFSGIDIPLAKTAAFSPSVYRTSFKAKGRYASSKEVDQINILLRQALIFKGNYMNVQSLESSNDPLVGKFNPKALDAKMIPILTKQEMDEGADSTIVKRKAEAIGRLEDINDFVAEQKLLHKKYITNKKPYPNPQFQTSTRPAGYVSQFGF
jgi:hypothetical protein